MKVQRYGAQKPTAGFDLLLDQLRLACRYRNQLVELHNWFILAKQQAKREGGDVGDVERLKVIRAEESRWLRSRCGLGWGTYQQIEADVQRALRSPFRPPRPGTGRARRWAQMRAIGIDPTWFRAQFRHFDGTGRIGATLQACNDSVTDELFGDHGSVRIGEPCGKRVRRGAPHLARLRVLGDQWIDVPILMHRPLPLGTKIVRAILCVERIGTRYVYSLHLTIHAPATAAPQPPQGSGNCAVNYGWRRTPEGTRVAYAVGDDGSEMELVLPRKLTDAMKHSEQLRSLADDHAVAYLGSAKLRGRARREALRDPEATHRELGKQPIEGEPVSREHWARRDRHLYQWERDEYAKVIRTRRQLYHLWALALAARYETVTVEDYNLARLIERDKPVEIPEARHVRFLVAPGSLREEVADVFGTERSKLLKPRGRTVVCNVCGESCKWDKARKVSHQCEHCGATWDQDANNAANQVVDAAAE